MMHLHLPTVIPFSPQASDQIGGGVPRGLVGFNRRGLERRLRKCRVHGDRFWLQDRKVLR